MCAFGGGVLDQNFILIQQQLLAAKEIKVRFDNNNVYIYIFPCCWWTVFFCEECFFAVRNLAKLVAVTFFERHPQSQNYLEAIIAAHWQIDLAYDSTCAMK